MSDILSARPATDPVPLRANGLTLSLEPPCETVSIGAFASGLAGLRAAIEAAFGVALPDGRGSARGAEGVRFIRMSRDQWFATASEGTGLPARLAAVCGGLAALTDQGDSRVTLTLSGPGARSIAMKLVPLDLHPEVFRPADAAATLAGHIPVLLIRGGGEAYGFTVLRGFAESLRHDIHAAMKGGVPLSERV